MALKDAFIRACRTAAQTFVALVVVVPVVSSVADIRKAAVSMAFAAVSALAAGLVAFAVNVTEDNTSFQLPK